MLVRKQFIQILKDLSEEDWNKPARHTIFGPTTLKELIKIRTGYTQETHPLEQRHGSIPGLRKHSLVELQEAEFTVDVPVDRWFNWHVQLRIL